MKITETASFSSLVQDPYTGHWIIVAPGRMKRPNNATKKKSTDPFSQTHLKNEKVLAVYGQGKNRITAIENKFPVFRSDRGLRGRQEILVEGRKKKSFAKFSTTMILSVLNAMVERSRAFHLDPQIKYMVVFKNEGGAAGASQLHAHSQVFGLSFIPEETKRMMQKRKQISKKYKLSPHDLALMQAIRERVIYADKHVVAFATPFARLPYEVRIITRRPLDNVMKTHVQERRSLAKALCKLLRLVRSRGWSFNIFFHDTFADKDEHFEVVFTPRTSVWAGFELDTGIVVNPVAPETAAAEYRAAK